MGLTEKWEDDGLQDYKRDSIRWLRRGNDDVNADHGENEGDKLRSKLKHFLNSQAVLESGTTVKAIQFDNIMFIFLMYVICTGVTGAVLLMEIMYRQFRLILQN